MKVHHDEFRSLSFKIVSTSSVYVCSGIAHKRHGITVIQETISVYLSPSLYL
jgi:hypothetical protein